MILSNYILNVLFNVMQTVVVNAILVVSTT